MPKLQLSLDQWTTFADLPQLNPLYCTHIDSAPDSDGDDSLFILLETNIYPDIAAISNGSEAIFAEKFGKPLAWKIDTTLAIVLQSNVAQFVELLRQTFLQNTLFINNYLPITRVQSECENDLIAYENFLH